eukprot:scpid39113/ scgid33225/ 
MTELPSQDVASAGTAQKLYLAKCSVEEVKRRTNTARTFFYALPDGVRRLTLHSSQSSVGQSMTMDRGQDGTSFGRASLPPCSLACCCSRAVCQVTPMISIRCWSRPTPKWSKY